MGIVLQRQLETAPQVHSECRTPLGILRRTVRRPGTDNSADWRPGWAGAVRSVRPQFQQLDASGQWCEPKLADTKRVCRAEDVQTGPGHLPERLHQFRAGCRLRLGASVVWKRKNECPRL